MAISRVRMNIFNYANREYNRQQNMHVDIDELCDFGTSKVRYGVNWSCCGTMDAEYTIKFADYMKFCARIVEEINRQELEFDWEAHDPDINSKEKFVEAKMQVLKWFEERRVGRIVDWFCDGDM